MAAGGAVKGALCSGEIAAKWAGAGAGARARIEGRARIGAGAPTLANGATDTGRGTGSVAEILFLNERLSQYMLHRSRISGHRTFLEDIC